MTIIQLKTPQLLIVISSLIFGGLAIGANLFGELSNGYIYGATSLLAGGTIILNSRKKV